MQSWPQSAGRKCMQAALPSSDATRAASSLTLLVRQLQCNGSATSLKPRNFQVCFACTTASVLYCRLKRDCSSHVAVDQMWAKLKDGHVCSLPPPPPARLPLLIILGSPFLPLCFLQILCSAANRLHANACKVITQWRVYDDASPSCVICPCRSDKFKCDAVQANGECHCVHQCVPQRVQGKLPMLLLLQNDAVPCSAMQMFLDIVE